MSDGNPNQNPYGSQFSTPVSPPVKPPSAGRPIARKASLGFFDSYFQSLNLMSPDYWLFWVLCVVGAIIGSIIPVILIGPMYCGLGLCYLAKSRGMPASFDLLFKGFDHFVATLIPVLIYFGLSMLVVPVLLIGIFGGIAIMATGEPIAIALGILIIGCSYLVGMCLMMVLSYGFLFSSFLVAEYQLEGMDAFSTSFDGLKKNFWGMLAVALAGALLSIAGALLCYIPLLLMIPMMFGGPFLCYQKIFTPVGGYAPAPHPSQPPKPGNY